MKLQEYLRLRSDPGVLKTIFHYALSTQVTDLGPLVLWLLCAEPTPVFQGSSAGTCRHGRWSRGILSLIDMAPVPVELHGNPQIWSLSHGSLKVTHTCGICSRELDCHRQTTTCFRVILLIDIDPVPVSGLFSDTYRPGLLFRRILLTTIVPISVLGNSTVTHRAATYSRGTLTSPIKLGNLMTQTEYQSQGNSYYQPHCRGTYKHTDAEP